MQQLRDAPATHNALILMQSREGQASTGKGSGLWPAWVLLAETGGTQMRKEMLSATTSCSRTLISCLNETSGAIKVSIYLCTRTKHWLMKSRFAVVSREKEGLSKVK